MLQLPQPIDPTPLLQENLRQRLALMQQPTTLAQIAPAIGQAVGQIGTAGIGAYQHAQQQKTLLAARQAAADYLSMTPEQRQDPNNAPRVQQGIAASLALGITPPQQQKSFEQMTAEEYARELAKRKADAAVPPPAKTETPEAAALRKQRQDQAQERLNLAKDKIAQDQSNRDQKLFQNIISVTIPTVAKRGSALGIAAQNNMKKDRLLEIASKPNPSPEEVRLMETDLAAVMQQGSPQQDLLAATHYGSIFQDWARVKEKFTGQPQDADSPEIVEKLKQLAVGVGSVDNEIISKNIGMIKSNPAVASAIKRNPDAWKLYENTILSSVSQGQGSETSSQESEYLKSIGVQ